MGREKVEKYFVQRPSFLDVKVVFFEPHFEAVRPLTDPNSNERLKKFFVQQNECLKVQKTIFFISLIHFEIGDTSGTDIIKQF